MTPRDRLGQIPPVGRVLGLDWGTARIGVAITDETQLIATPLDLFTRRAGKRLPIAQFLTLVTREQPVGLVVGLPFDDDGREGASARSARDMGEMFAVRSNLPLDWVDESFTTARVLGTMAEVGGSRRRHQREIDPHAAAELLQRWLDARRGGAMT